MLVVGLTGGISTGKSSVSAILKKKRVQVIDADLIARQVVEPGTPALVKITTYFGSEVLHPDGTLNRKKLGSLIFNDEVKRRRLDSIVHPAVQRAMLWEILKHWISGRRYVVVDVPLLIETGLWKWVGMVVVVYCSAEVQLQRLMQRDAASREEASARLSSQRAIAEKLQYADRIIDNSGSPEDLEIQADALVQALDRKVGWSWRVSWLFPPWGVLSAMWVLISRAVIHKI
ncbi:dephospho-CoA kinase-domain-containing protein [Mycena vitilis]|nr:dephospho-CoA kinase-domain-containing protein [Mycena vitilis]